MFHVAQGLRLRHTLFAHPPHGTCRPLSPRCGHSQQLKNPCSLKALPLFGLRGAHIPGLTHRPRSPLPCLFACELVGRPSLCQRPAAREPSCPPTPPPKASGVPKS